MPVRSLLMSLALIGSMLGTEFVGVVSGPGLALLGFFVMLWPTLSIANDSSALLVKAKLLL